MKAINFINQFASIPAHLWKVSVFENFNGLKDEFQTDADSSGAASKAYTLLALFRDYLGVSVTSVSKGECGEYFQQTSKERVIAALKDIHLKEIIKERQILLQNIADLPMVMQRKGDNHAN